MRLKHFARLLHKTGGKPRRRVFREVYARTIHNAHRAALDEFYLTTEDLPCICWMGQHGRRFPHTRYRP